MRQTSNRAWRRLVVLVGTLGLPPALAAQTGAALLSPGELMLAAEPAAPTPAPPETAEAPPLFTAAVPDAALAESRGGDYTLEQVAQASSTATQSDNIAYGNHTGSNWISDAAFSGSDGFSTAIQNSGNNVVIQNSLIINVTYAQ